MTDRQSGGIEPPAPTARNAGLSDPAVEWRRIARLIPVSEDEFATSEPEVRRLIAQRLARALRAERKRGRAGHWSYDLNRHLALKQAAARFRDTPD